MKKNEEVSLVTKVSFEGSVLDLGAHEIDLSGKKIEDKKTLTKLLSHVKDRIKFVMCDTGLSNEELGEMREKFPHLEFAWRLYMGKWSLRTDDEAFSVMIYTYDYVRMTSEDISVLIGSESSVKVMNNSAIVFKPIVRDGKTLGVIGVLGPLRMDYAKVLETIEQLCGSIVGIMDEHSALAPPGKKQDTIKIDIKDEDDDTN